MSTAPARLSPAQVARGMRLSKAEGSLWALMVGFSETYFLADAVRLGATPLEQGLVVTLPLFLGGIGSLLAVAGFTRVQRRRVLAVNAVLLQVAVLAAIAVVEALGGMTPALLIAAACAYQMSGQAAGIAWSSWYGDLVPAEIRGRYFAQRNRLVTIFTSVGLLTGGLLLQLLEPGTAAAGGNGVTGRGFLVIYGVAMICRLGSAVLLRRSPEPRFRGIADRSTTARFFGSRRGQVIRRLMLAGAAFHLVVYLASPYFGPYMLEGLDFAYWEYMTATLVAVVCKSLLLPLWGRRIDHRGARSVYILAARLVALVPLPWIFAQNLVWVVGAQCLSGAAWSGYEVSYFSLMLESSTSRARPYVFAAHNVLAGSAQLLGTLAAAGLLGLPGWSFPRLFLVSLGLRVALGAFLPKLIPPIDSRRPPQALRQVGVRPHGGVNFRPIDRPTDAE